MPATEAEKARAKEEYAAKVAREPTQADMDVDGLPKFDFLRRQKAWFADKPAPDFEGQVRRRRKY